MEADQKCLVNGTSVIVWGYEGKPRPWITVAKMGKPLKATAGANLWELGCVLTMLI